MLIMRDREKSVEVNVIRCKLQHARLGRKADLYIFNHEVA